MAVVPLTTMRQDILALGHKCVEQVMQLIDGKPLATSSYFLDAELIVRESTRNE